MLRRIHIRNHALITEVELNFDEGFHVFTGETGSGKSILLGALGLLLGKRADTASVGLSSDRAVVEGWFSAPHLEGWLLAQDLPATPRLTIRREVLKNGRSRVFVNDAQASVAQLKALGEQLVDIHQQHDLGVSLEREALCHLLDQVGGHQAWSTPTKPRTAIGWTRLRPGRSSTTCPKRPKATSPTSSTNARSWRR